MNTPGGNNPSGGKTWPEARVERLKQLWSEGHTASQIAAILGGGLTRNGVIGAARRAGCEGRKSPIVRKEKRDADPATLKSAAKAQDAAFTARITAALQSKAAAETRGRQGNHTENNPGGIRARQTSRAHTLNATAASSAKRRTDIVFGAPSEKPRAVETNPFAAPPAPRVEGPAWDGKPVDQFVIKPGQCRNIVQEDPARLGHVLMCGAPTENSEPYCPGCRRRMWVGFKAPQAGEVAA